MVSWNQLHKNANILLLAVKHDYYNQINLIELKDKVDSNGVIYDIKSTFPKEKIKELGLITIIFNNLC